MLLNICGSHNVLDSALHNLCFILFCSSATMLNALPSLYLLIPFKTIKLWVFSVTQALLCCVHLVLQEILCGNVGHFTVLQKAD